jgi:hypothetical protein
VPSGFPKALLATGVSEAMYFPTYTATTVPGALPLKSMSVDPAAGAVQINQIE